MEKCMLCAREDDGIRLGSMPLCACCHGQLCALRPEEGRYWWYVRAMSRARCGRTKASCRGKYLAGSLDLLINRSL